MSDSYPNGEITPTPRAPTLAAEDLARLHQVQADASEVRMDFKQRRTQFQDSRTQLEQSHTQLHETWSRYIHTRAEIVEGRDMQRATLNLLEDTELARRGEERQSAERARAEAAQDASETKYRTLFESIDEGFCTFDMIFDAAGVAVDYRFVEHNPAFERHTGLKNVVGRTIREVLPNQERQWFELYGRVALTGEPIRVTRYGEALGRWIEVYAFRTGVPEQRRVAALFSDVTARKEAEAERERLLHEAESARAAADLEQRRLRAVLEQLPVGVHIAEAPGGRLMLDNAALRALCGDAPLSASVADYSRDYAGHYPAGHPRAGEAMASHEWPMARTLATGAAASEELVEIRRADGTRRLANVSAAAVRDADGQMVGAVATIVDVTAMKRAEEELRESEQRLREADRRKNFFLAMLSHELRNPLAAIRGGVAVLVSDKTKPATRARALPIVGEQVAHMERLVNDLLDVTSIVEGRVQLRLERVTLQQVVTDAYEMLRGQITERKFDLQKRIDAEPLIVQGDPVRLRQVVVNVLGNALKYSGAARRVELTLTKSGTTAQLSIRDFGQGIPADLLPRIFEPFVQGKPSMTLEGGLGLGLAVVRQLVNLHGGSVEAFSGGELQGSKFVIELPLAPGAA